MYDVYAGNKAPFVFKLLARIFEPLLFDSAKKISVMCEELQEHYQKKYNREIVVIHNSIEFDPSEISEPPQMSNNEIFRIVYLGSIYWAQLDAIKRMIEVVNSIREKKIEFVLYTPNSQEYLNSVGIFANDRIKFTSCSPEDALTEMHKANLLFVGLSFNSGFDLLINTSSPGKLCDYLIAGRPILVHSPNQSFLSKYALKYGFASIVGEPDIDKLRNELLRIMELPDLSQQVKNAINLGIENHWAKTTAAELINLI
jgi:hypothetical protein